MDKDDPAAFAMAEMLEAKKLKYLNAKSTRHVDTMLRNR